MPELPEVEVLVHHLRPLVQNRRIKRVSVVRRKVLRSTSETELKHALEGATILDIQRRGKYLVFSCRARPELQPFLVLGHLGMTGRMFLLPEGRVLPRHVAVTLDLGGEMFIFQDPRIFGRFTLEAACLHSFGARTVKRRMDCARRVMERVEAVAPTGKAGCSTSGPS